MRLLTKTIILIFVLFLSIRDIAAQDIVSDVIEKTMRNVRTNTVEAIDNKILYKTENYKRSIAILGPYSIDSSYAVRKKAYSMKGSLAKKFSDEIIRKQTVNDLLAGCRDVHPQVQNECIQLLQQFRSMDFDLNSKDKLKSLISESKINSGSYAQLGAFAQVENLDIILLQKLTEGIPPKDKWAIRLALARTGHEESIQFVVDKIKSIPVNDDLIYEAVPAILYTRQKKAISYLIDLVNSDKKNCTSANPDSEEPILCGYRILEQLAPVIKDFPIKLDAAGELKGDYVKSITIARNWFKEKKSDYFILKSTY